MKINWAVALKAMIPCGILMMVAGAAILYYRGVFSQSLPNPTLDAILMAAFFLGGVLTFAGIFVRDQVKRAENRRTVRIGIPSSARAATTEQRGHSRSDGTSEAHLTVEIQGPDGRTSTTQATISVDGGKTEVPLSPGSQVQVHYDSENPTRSTRR